MKFDTHMVESLLQNLTSNSRLYIKVITKNMITRKVAVKNDSTCHKNEEGEEGVPLNKAFNCWWRRIYFTSSTLFPGVLKRIFGPQKDGVIRGWRQLHNKELNDYSSYNIEIGQIKEDEMDGTCSTHGREKCS
jgi:hypothetical protein